MAIGCLQLSNISVICCVVNPRWTSRKIWGRFLYSVQAGNDVELITVVKMETRNAIDGYFGTEFLAICDHFRVMVA